MHSDVDGHETLENMSPAKPNDSVAPSVPVHVAPPSTVEASKETVPQGWAIEEHVPGTGAALPTATQVVVDGHAMPSSASESAGRLSIAHVVPPFVVVMTPAAPSTAPTMLHVLVEGHETPKGENVSPNGFR